jgi:iron complex outermembrane recepter protein
LSKRRKARRESLLILLAVLAGALTFTCAHAAALEQRVPPESLSDALEAFAKETGYQVVYRTELVSGLTSKGAPAGLSSAETLRQLLRDTGLVFTFVNERTVAIIRPGEAARTDLESKDQSKESTLVIVNPSATASSDTDKKTEETSMPNQKKGLIGRIAGLFTLCGPLMLAEHAYCQETPADTSVETLQEVVVTGTLIRGVAPVGSNLVSIGVPEIEAMGATDMTDIITNLPMTGQFGNVTQGMTNSSYYAPTIHSLGASASNSTLVMVDDHRIPSGGFNHGLTDPSIVPAIAIQNVDIIADGASSIYGTDAVAGVINFVTRSKFDGFEVQGQGGTGDSYGTQNFGALWGSTWDNGWALVAGSYDLRDSIPNSARSFLYPNHTAQGGTNFLSFSCAPASIQPAGSALIFLSPTAATGTVNAAANAPCNTSQYGDLVPREERENMLVKFERDFGDNLKINTDVLLSRRVDTATAALGTLSATAYDTGAQANPFYVDPPGVTAATQTVRVNLDGLLSGKFNDPVNVTGNETAYVANSADYHLAGDWHATLNSVVGWDRGYMLSDGSLCASCVSLALNGTTNTSGSLTAPSIPGTNGIITQALTAANALDVWDPAGTNKTSAAVINSLVSGYTSTEVIDEIKEVRLGADGSVLHLPAGSVRVALGGEFTYYSETQTITTDAISAPGLTYYDFGRSVASGYGEVDIPVIGADMHVPLVKKFDVDVSGRYDHYSDVGPTKNPKFAATWTVTDDVKLRGNYSTAFVAPWLDSVQKPPSYAAEATSFNVPVANYPNVTQIPGCAGQTVNCTISSTTQGIILSGANSGLKPETGSDWSIGADFTPTFAPGLKLSVTNFNDNFTGGVTSPNLSAITSASALNHLLVFYPNGATLAQVAAFVGNAPVSGVLPSKIYYTYDFRQANVLNLDISGIDFSANYRLPTQIGVFRAGDFFTYFTKYTEQNGTGGAVYSVLNTSGINQTFPSIKFQMRANVGWDFLHFTGDFFWNYTGSYLNWGSTAVNPVISTNGAPSGGGDVVSSFSSFDAHLSYQLPKLWTLTSSQIFMNVTNIANTPPAFYNSAIGYNNFVGNPIGRIIAFGFRAKW